MTGLAEYSFGGSLESGGLFCFGVFGRIQASIAVKMFKHLIYFVKAG
jgi:preprotein translocase subunit SecY